MSARRWVTHALVLSTCCASACSNGNGAPGTDVTPVASAGTAAMSGAGVSGANTGGAAPTTIAATSGSGGAGAMAMRPTAGTSGGGSGAAGTGAAGSGGTAAGSGGSAAADSGRSAAGSGGVAGMDAPAMPMTGSLPAIMDPAMPGPFKVKRTNNAGPMRSYTTFEPEDLGREGIKHPILVWGPGAGSNPDIYLALLNHIATHGFVVVSYNSTPQGPELTRGIDWIIEEGKKEGGPYFNKVDTTKIAMGGQSAGSLATFTAGKEQRLTTTLHINGGTFNHNDAKNLIKPAFFVCGDDPAKTGGDGTWESDLARPNCDADFMTATVPVWYGVVIGSSHTTVIDNPLDNTVSPLKAHYLASTVAWLRYQLAGDQVMKALFVGPDCGYCKQTMVWEVKQKDLM
ncbi:MAG TPA: hypothetical protein VJV78_36940 [Polyangiales bacterium]|nr:hypothetical protein [Polyangiales bacterium]